MCGSSRARLRTALNDGDSGSRPSPPRPRPRRCLHNLLAGECTIPSNLDHFPGRQTRQMTDGVNGVTVFWYIMVVMEGEVNPSGVEVAAASRPFSGPSFSRVAPGACSWERRPSPCPPARSHLSPRKIPSFPSKMSASDVGPAGWAPLGRGGGGGRVPGDAGGVMPEPTGGLGASSDAGSRRGSLLGGGGGGCELSSASPASVSLALIPPSAAILDGERGWCVSRPARSGFEFLLFLLCRFSG